MMPSYVVEAVPELLLARLLVVRVSVSETFQ